MNVKEFEEKISGIVKVLEESNIIERALALGKRGKKNVHEANDWTTINHSYYFLTDDKKQSFKIESGDAYCWGDEKQVYVEYNGETVLKAVQCKPSEVPEKRYTTKNKNREDDLLIYAEQKNQRYYKVSVFTQGSWEDFFKGLETGMIKNKPEPEPVVEEPELDINTEKMLNNRFT